MDTSLKRIIAFVIDVVIISLVVSLINLLPIDPYQEKYKDTYEKYNEVVKKSSEDGSHDYKDEIIELNYEVYKYRTYSSIISATALILYFGVVPVVMNGQTIGKKMMKIKIVKEDDKLTINDLALRSLLANGIAMTFIELALIFLIKDTPYFITISILSFVQFY